MRKWQGDLAFILIVGLLIGGWFYLYPRPTPSPLTEIEPPLDLNIIPLTFSSPQGDELAYRLYAPQGTVRCILVLLHDSAMHGAWYAQLGQQLGGAGIAVFLPDQRGHGYSSGDRQQIAQNRDILNDDITAMIAAAQARYPTVPIFLGGHGRGAGLALRYIQMRRPVDGLVLIAPYISETQTNLSRAGQRRWLVAHPIEAFLARAGLTHWPVWHYNWPTHMAQIDPRLDKTLSILWMHETVPDDLDAAFQSVQTPLLCVIGQDDFLFDPDTTPQWLEQFTAARRELAWVPQADFLSIIPAAAPPIARWLDQQLAP